MLYHQYIIYIFTYHNHLISSFYALLQYIFLGYLYSPILKNPLDNLVSILIQKKDTSNNNFRGSIYKFSLYSIYLQQVNPQEIYYNIIRAILYPVYLIVLTVYFTI